MTAYKNWQEDFIKKVKDGYKVIINPSTKGKSTYQKDINFKNRSNKDLYVIIDECAWGIYERNKYD